MNTVKIVTIVKKYGAEGYITGAEIEVPGLGYINIDNCISNETMEKIKQDVLVTLSQKFKEATK